jgi:putative addiction module component (TIGR02574 family)
MSSLLNSLGIDRLSIEQRIQLAEAIWDSLEAEAEPLPLTEAQKQELDRRSPPDQSAPRPLGLARGLGKIHESFFDPLPPEVEDAFRGIGE